MFGYLDSTNMVSYNLSIDSKAVKVITKEIQGKNTQSAINYPSLTHKGDQKVNLTGFQGHFTNYSRAPICKTKRAPSWNMH